MWLGDFYGAVQWTPLLWRPPSRRVDHHTASGRDGNGHHRCCCRKAATEAAERQVFFLGAETKKGISRHQHFELSTVRRAGNLAKRARKTQCEIQGQPPRQSDGVGHQSMAGCVLAQEFGSSRLRAQVRSGPQRLVRMDPEMHLGPEGSSEVVSCPSSGREAIYNKRLPWRCLGAGQFHETFAKWALEQESGARFWRDVVGCRGGPVWWPRSRFSLVDCVATSHTRVRQMLALAAFSSWAELRRWVGPGLAGPRRPAPLHAEPPSRSLSSFRLRNTNGTFPEAMT
jgi:hypothetical protein